MDAPFSKPHKEWTRKERINYEGQIQEARAGAMEKGKPGFQCAASGSLASQVVCAETGCGMCKGAIAASAKQSELTGYDPATEKPTK